jgi:uncharacterized protein
VEAVLARERVVRIGFHVDGVTYIVPVFYVWHDGALSGYTTPGRKLQMARENGDVAFQVDSSAATGVWEWHSVTGHGRYEVVSDESEVAAFTPMLQKMLADAPSWAIFSRPNLQQALRDAGLVPWRIRPLEIGGRQRSGD